MIQALGVHGLLRARYNTLMACFGFYVFLFCVKCSSINPSTRGHADVTTRPTDHTVPTKPKFHHILNLQNVALCYKLTLLSAFGYKLTLLSSAWHSLVLSHDLWMSFFLIKWCIITDWLYYVGVFGLLDGTNHNNNVLLWWCFSLWGFVLCQILFFLS